MTDANHRHSDLPVDPLFLNRWSPRAFDGALMPEADLLTMLEAARWAPSASNVQPWRFVYALRDSTEWAVMLDLLVPFNQAWASKAAALLFVVSATHLPANAEGVENPSHSHAFDSGAAWAHLAIQAHLMGYHAHGMLGFAMDRALPALGFPAGSYRAECAVAIGRLGDPALLPDFLQPMEKPSNRKPLADIAFRGSFGGSRGGSRGGNLGG